MSLRIILTRNPFPAETQGSLYVWWKPHQGPAVLVKEDEGDFPILLEIRDLNVGSEDCGPLGGWQANEKQ